MNLKGRIRNLLMAALTVLLCVGYVNSTMCWHSHIIGGRIVVHSHLHAESHHGEDGTTDGGHNPGQLRLIQESNEISLSGSILPEIALKRIDVLTDIFSAPEILPVREISARVALLRAPPVV